MESNSEFHKYPARAALEGCYHISKRDLIPVGCEYDSSVFIGRLGSYLMGGVRAANAATTLREIPT
jgi:hypothetical protein